MESAPTIWVVGGGKFGLMSARALRRHRPGARLIVVEIDPEVCRHLETEGFDVVSGDAVDFVHDRLHGPFLPEWIVPVVPVHLAYEWIKRRLQGRWCIRPLAVPQALDGLVVSVLRGADGTVYTSNADFTCPDDCPEPAAVCMFTGKARPCVMHAMLAGLDLPGFSPVVIRSHQLLPGVGGYRPEALFTALAAVETAAGPVLLASACCCHGVVNAFEMARRTCT